MAIATPLQIVVSRDGDDRRTDGYVDTLRLAFEGSAEAASSPSAYLADAVDLGVRVLEPAGDIEEAEIGALVGGAQETVVVVIGEGSAQSAALEGIVGVGARGAGRVPAADGCRRSSGCLRRFGGVRVRAGGDDAADNGTRARPPGRADWWEDGGRFVRGVEVVHQSREDGWCGDGEVADRGAPPAPGRQTRTAPDSSISTMPNTSPRGVCGGRCWRRRRANRC